LTSDRNTNVMITTFGDRFLRNRKWHWPIGKEKWLLAKDAQWLVQTEMGNTVYLAAGWFMFA
jgi:hypothetical protein